jgi:hypothetical protein
MKRILLLLSIVVAHSPSFGDSASQPTPAIQQEKLQKLGQERITKSRDRLRCIYVDKIEYRDLTTWHRPLTCFLTRYFYLPETQEELNRRLDVASLTNDKELHDRITNEGLQNTQLIKLTQKIRQWPKATSALAYICVGYGLNGWLSS